MKLRKIVILLMLFPISTILNNVYAADDLLTIYALAVKNNPTLAAAYSNKNLIEERVEQSRALKRPTVNFTMNMTHSETDIKFNGANRVFRDTGRQSFENYGYVFNANQPIYRKQNNVQLDQTLLQEKQSEVQIALSQQDLMLKTTQAYFEVLAAQDRLALLGAQKNAVSRQLEQAKANFEVGTATITDVNEAQAKYDLTLAQEIATESELEVKKRMVQAITSRPPDKLATVQGGIKIERAAIDMEVLVQSAEQNNLELQIQQKNLEMANKDIEKAQAAHLPTLDAVASYADSRANGGINGFGSDSTNATIGMQLVIPIYQGGAVNSKVREAQALVQKTQDDLEAVRREVSLNVRQAYLNHVSSIAQVTAYEQALKSSQSQLDSTQLGYEVGVRTSVDVLNAQQQLFNAKKDLMQSRYNYLLSKIQVKYATGELAQVDLEEINQLLSQ